jgi:hypothetical protein
MVIWEVLYPRSLFSPITMNSHNSDWEGMKPCSAPVGTASTRSLIVVFQLISYCAKHVNLSLSLSQSLLKFKITLCYYFDFFMFHERRSILCSLSIIFFIDCKTLISGTKSVTIYIMLRLHHFHNLVDRKDFLFTIYVHNCHR